MIIVSSGSFMYEEKYEKEIYTFLEGWGGIVMERTPSGRYLPIPIYFMLSDIVLVGLE